MLSSCKVVAFVAGEIMVVAKVNRKMVSVVRTSHKYTPFLLSTKLQTQNLPFTSFPGTFLHVSAGTRTTCGVEVKSQTTTSIHCWGGRANALLDQVDFQRKIMRCSSIITIHKKEDLELVVLISKMDNTEYLVNINKQKFLLL